MLTETTLNDLNVKFKKDGSFFNIPDVGGTIIEDAGFLFFIHGNRTIRVSIENENIKEYIKAYITGFDEFAEALKKFRWNQ